nr:integrase, catalytic region, zinc finger, CCHC-type, peptidase aspartic, catalytic [Tanacetum cinerariifolium]
LIEIVLFIIDSGCSKHMTGNLKLLINFVEKFLGLVKFRNDQIAPILGYGDLVQGAVTIKRVYYVKGLNHNLFSVGQFCDADLEVAFRKSTCFIRDLKGNDLLTGSRGMDLYSITLQDTNCPNIICLMAKATSSQAWLWHRLLSHLNFDTINLLSKNDIVVGLPKLKFVKDHLCSSYEFFNAGSNQQDKQPTMNIQPTSAPSTPIYVHAEENNDNQAEEEHLPDDEFTNPFCIPAQEDAESSSHNIGNSNVPTFNQPQVSEYRWMKDHPLEQVHRNPSRPVQTRRQLATDPEMCMFALTVSTTEPKNIKEAMADYAWIEADVYVTQLDGFVDPDHPEKVYRLRKALYGLKQAPKAWYDELSKFLTSKGFTKGTIDPTLFTIRYGDDILLMQIYGSRFGLTAFLDADHVGCIDSRKSTSGGIQFLGDKLVSWMSKKQNYTAMSSVEAEYVALSASCAQVMWMRTQLQDYGFNYNKIPLYCDSQSAIEISCNPVQHSHTKHIHTRYHFIKEEVKNVKMEILLEPTSNKLLVVYQGRLLANFQDDAKYDYVGQDTRSQGGKDDQEKKDKDLKISDEKTKSKENNKRLKTNNHKA